MQMEIWKNEILNCSLKSKRKIQTPREKLTKNTKEIQTASKCITVFGLTSNFFNVSGTVLRAFYPPPQ